MNRPKLSLVVILAVEIARLISPQAAQACAVCYGDPQSPMTAGMNMAILSLLGITGMVLATFAAFFVFIRKRARMRLEGPVTIDEILNGRRRWTND